LLPNVSILQLLTDAGGKTVDPSAGRRSRTPKKRASLGASDTVTAQSPPCQKTGTAEYWFPTSSKALSVFTADDVQKLGPSSPPVISMTETADGKVWLGTLGDGLFFLTDGRATNVNAGLPDRKINSLLPIDEELWVGHRHRLVSRKTATAFVGSSCRRSSVMSKF